MWLSFGGRPHWGKLIYKLPEKKVWGGGTGMENFMRVRDKLDPLRVFRTDFHYDVFDRKLPKLITVKVVKAELKDDIWQRIASLGSWMSSFFYTKEYRLTVETAVDRREAYGTASGNIMEYGATMKNVNFTNFIQFQVICNNEVIGTAVWHLNLDNDLAAGHTSTKRLQLNPNWFTHADIGTIEVELTPINVSYPDTCEERVAIIGNASHGDLATFAKASHASGFKVFVGVPEGTEEADVRALLAIPNLVLTTPHSAAKCASLVVFAGDFETMRDLARVAGDLTHKIVVDASERSGAEGGASVFAQTLGVVRVVYEPEIKGKEKTLLVESAGDAASRTVEQWAALMGFTVSKVKKLSASTELYNSLVTLPQHDPNQQNRQQSLVINREGHLYDHSYYKDCSVPGRFPLIKDSLLDPYYVYSVITRLASQFFKYQILQKFSLNFDSNTLSGYLPMSPFVEQHFPSTNEVWCPDAALGASRLGGPEPRGLRRIENWYDLPNREDFPFTDGVLQHVLSDPSITVRTEMAAGRLFLVNHKILLNIERVPAVPIAVFWWNEKTKELLPIAIQVFQQHHPTENPLVTAKDGLLWEAAKIYFQAATASVHASCSHEYEEHVIMGAFAMATPRQLYKTHPVFVLLQPHLHRTVSHAATRNCKTRCHVPTMFFDATADSLRSLVTATARQSKFYSYSFDQNIKDRKVAKYPPSGNYPYRDDGLLLWNAITSFVSEYIDLFYQLDEDITADYEIQEWIKDLEGPHGGRLNGVLVGDENSLKTKAELVRIVATVIFMAGPHHAATHYVQTEYLTAPHHILPGLVRMKWPIKEPLTPEVIHKILPSKTTAMHQAQIFNSASLQYDKFGDYSLFPLGTLTVAQEAIQNFQSELNNIEQIILERETKRKIPYPYFLPSRIPNATNI
eukprot:Phypoly_transcript_00647.p1 GENE.Phypoly_transcript_00647~~Phypoly_transcript_00647.p1  ORF type:complete len:912 (+),score=132.37 Phypoly_transcript_00647:1514-4249(+)